MEIYEQFQGRISFTDVPEKDWGDWRWQKRNAITIYPGDKDKGKKYRKLLTELGLPSDFDERLLSLWAINLSPHTINQLLRLKQQGYKEWFNQMTRWLIPSSERLVGSERLSEFEREGMGTTPRHKTAYPDLPWCMKRLYNNRVIVMLSSICPVACQFCFRQHDVAEHHELEGRLRKGISESLAYVSNWNRSNPDKVINDVIFSGGDPLSLSDDILIEILRKFKAIEGVKLLRIDTKYPVAVPQRITDKLVKRLKEFQPLIVNIHFTHQGEICAEVKRACDSLVEAGIMLGSHTPLLRGINDDRETLKTLFWNLLLIRVRAFYLIQHIDTPGTEQFRVSVEKGLELIKYLESELSGPAQPHYILYTIGGGGKVHLQPIYLKEKLKGGWLVDTWQGVEFYPDPDL